MTGSNVVTDVASSSKPTSGRSQSGRPDTAHGLVPVPASARSSSSPLRVGGHPQFAAAQAGTVVYSGRSPYEANGIEVSIRHSNGLCIQYIHLNRALYNAGTRIPQGRVVAWSGSTGNSTAPHLHFQVIDCDTRVSQDAELQGWVPPTGSWPESVNTRARTRGRRARSGCPRRPDGVDPLRRRRDDTPHNDGQPV